MKIDKVVELIESIAPTDHYLDIDNSGIQIQCGKKEIKKVLVCLEINDDIISEAKKKKADMIITHHPLLFYPIKQVTPDTPVGRYVIELIKSGITVCSSHLPFDAADGGNNMYMAGLLGLEDVALPDKDRIGTYGYLKKPMDFKQFKAHVEKSLDLPKNYVRCVDGGCEKISKVAFCTGAGGDSINDAVEWGCDAYITGDLKLHEAQYAKAMGLTVIDAGHYGTEKIFTENMAAQLRDAVAGGGYKLDVIEAASNTNPYIL